MGMMLQLRPLFKVRQAGTHVPGFKPGIAPTLTAVRPNLTGRTFVMLARLCLVDGLLEHLPACFHRTGTEIITWEREGGAEIHLAIRSDCKSALTAGAFDEGGCGRARGLGFDQRRSPPREHLLIKPDFCLRGKAIL